MHHLVGARLLTLEVFEAADRGLLGGECVDAPDSADRGLSSAVDTVTGFKRGSEGSLEGVPSDTPPPAELGTEVGVLGLLPTGAACDPPSRLLDESLDIL